MSILPRETGGGIFGQGAFQVDPNATPDQIAMKRQLMAAMMPRYGEAKYIGQGIGQALTGLAHGRMNRNLDKAEGAGRKSAAERFQQLLGGGTAQPGGFSILGAAPQPEPNSPQGIADDTMAALGKGPVGREFVVDGLVARNFPQHVAEGFAMNFADESAFNPQAVGDNGNAYGLAQWNGPRKRALFDFAERQGKNPADPNVQMDFLAHEVQGPESAAWGKIAATSDPRAAAAAVLNYFERPAETHRARREAAYLGGQPQAGGQPQQPQGAPLEALYAAAADPWLDQGQRAIIMSMIQTRQQESDPLRQMQLQKGQLELEQMRNPQQPEELTTRRALAAEAGLQPGTPEYQSYMATGDLPKSDPVEQDTFTGPDGTVYRFNPVTGEALPLTGAKPQPQPMTPEARAQWGIPQSDTRPYVMKDGVPTLIGGNGVTVNNNMGGSVPADEEELRKKLGGKEGESWAAYLDAGAVSAGTAQDMQLMDQLIDLAPTGPLQGRMVEMFPGISDAGAAFKSVVSRVAPTLRAPGSGATSDIEYDGMVKSLPALKNRPEANRAISGMMKAKAQINMDRAAVVSAYQNNEISAADARKQLQEINSRSIMTPELKAVISALDPKEGASAADDEMFRKYGIAP